MPEHDDALLAIFDHDGVLVDSLDHHQRAWVQLGEREGLPITAAFIRETFGMTNASILGKLLGDDLPNEQVARLTDLKEAGYRELAQDLALMDGVPELLENLDSAGFKLAIGSSAVLANLELTVARWNLHGRFAGIASSEDIVRGKPDPEVFLVAARKVGVRPERTVVFEDAAVGIRAAKAAGMRAVGVTTTTDAASLRNAGADEVVATLAGYDVARLVSVLRAD